MQPLSGNGSDIYTLHYELAAEVRSLREKQSDFRENLGALTLQVAAPKPIPWGPLATGLGVIAGIAFSIGALVEGGLSRRIDEQRRSLEQSDQAQSRALDTVSALNTRRYDSIAAAVHGELAGDSLIRRPEMTMLIARLGRVESYVDTFVIGRCAAASSKP